MTTHKSRQLDRPPRKTPMNYRLQHDLEPFMDPLYRYAMVLAGSDCDARDLVQETMLRAVKHRSQFEKFENKRAWLFKVLSNTYRDWMRQRKRQPIAALIIDPMAECETPLRNSEIQEHHAEIFNHIQKLPDVQRQVLYLRCVEEYSIRQMATTLATTENNVKANLSIARKKIKEAMKRHDEKVLEQ